MQLNERMKAKS